MGTDIVLDKTAKPNTFLQFYISRQGLSWALCHIIKICLIWKILSVLPGSQKDSFKLLLPISMHALRPFCFPVSVTKKAEKLQSEQEFQLCGFVPTNPKEPWKARWGSGRGKWCDSSLGWVLSPLQHLFTLPAESCCLKQEVLALFQRKFLILTCKSL